MYTLAKTRSGFAPFARFFEDVVGDLSGTAPAWAPALDLVETPDAFVVRMDVPGIAPDGIDLSYEKGRLVVRGEKPAEEKVEGHDWRRIERHAGAFERVIRVGESVDTEKLTAEASHGVLTITLPKRAETKPRTIPVRVR